MRFFSIASLLYLTSTLANAASIPTIQDLLIRDVPTPEQAYHDLEKRKGGGGGSSGGSSGGSGGSSSGSSHGSSSGSSSSGGSRSGSSSSSSSGSSSGSSSSGSGSHSGSSSSSSSSSSGSSGSRPLSSYSFSSSSNVGGRTRSGSGLAPAYGSGRYYAGGATVPYAAGGRSPLGLTPFIFPLAALSFFPGLWLYGAYAYPYTHPYYYHNTSQQDSGSNNSTNSSIPVTCLCQQYSECGCDDSNNSTLIANMMGTTNGSVPQNSSIIRVVDFGNGTTELFINGTLPNGTTASGGTDPSNASQISGADVARFSGYWVMAATVLAAVMLA